jgi:hypothetical protein
MNSGTENATREDAQLLGTCIFLKEKRAEEKRIQEKREENVYTAFTSSSHKQLVLLGFPVSGQT